MSKTRIERIASIEEKLEQLENRRKQLLQKHQQEKRKARTRRLIQRGRILEQCIPRAETYTDEEIKAILRKAFAAQCLFCRPFSFGDA